MDYTTSAYLLDENGQLVAQDDSQPFMGERPMTAWEINQIIYDPKFLEPNQPLVAGDYQVMIAVYHLVEGEVSRLSTINGKDDVGVGVLNLEG